MQKLTISPILCDETPWKSRVAIRAVMIKATTVKYFWASLVCWMLESLQLLNWAIHWYKLHLKWQWWQYGTIDKPGTSLFPHYTIRSARHTHPILLVSTILDFSTPNFKAAVISTFVIHLLWKFTKWLKTCWKNVVCSFVELLRVVLKFRPSKSCATFFAPPDIFFIGILHFMPCKLSMSLLLRMHTLCVVGSCHTWLTI